jgi:hypothetical protein
MILLEGMWNVLWMVWMEMWESFFRVFLILICKSKSKENTNECFAIPSGRNVECSMDGVLLLLQ